MKGRGQTFPFTFIETFFGKLSSWSEVVSSRQNLSCICCLFSIIPLSFLYLELLILFICAGVR